MAVFSCMELTASFLHGLSHPLIAHMRFTNDENVQRLSSVFFFFLRSQVHVFTTKVTDADQRGSQSVILDTNFHSVGFEKFLLLIHHSVPKMSRKCEKGSFRNVRQQEKLPDTLPKSRGFFFGPRLSYFMA